MAALRYQPNHTARTLRSRSSHTIGCMFSDVTNPLYARAYKALDERFGADGYMLLLANSLGDVNRELEILKTLKARGMDGVICAPGHERDPRVLEVMNSMTMPVLLYDREVEGARADAILFDHVSGMRVACEKLFSLGHRRIALALWHADSRPVLKRIEGYKAAYAEIGLPPPDLILRQKTPVSSVFDDMLALLQGDDPPTALIAQGTHILVSALRAVDAVNLSIPDDFSVISIGDSDFTQTHGPTITSLRTNTELVAQIASQMLLERLGSMAALQHPPNQVLIPYDLIERDSCAECRM